MHAREWYARVKARSGQAALWTPVRKNAAFCFQEQGLGRYAQVLQNITKSRIIGVHCNKTCARQWGAHHSPQVEHALEKTRRQDSRCSTESWRQRGRKTHHEPMLRSRLNLQ